MENRESRRLFRGNSGSTNVGADLSNITKEQKEMRTSSATAGITNTEYKLLNITGNVPINGLNLNNYNTKGGNSVNHAISGVSRISVISAENNNSANGSQPKQKIITANGKKIQANRNLGSANSNFIQDQLS